MKFSVSSSDLLKKLQVAAGAIGSNPVLPILEDFLFSISGNRLTITTSDLETTIITSIEVNADGDGQVAVPAKILLDTLKELPQQPVTFQIDKKNFGVEITSAYGKYRLAGENGADFPKAPEPDSVDQINLSSDTIHQAISKTIFATSNDELRPAMTGVFLEVDFNHLTFVSTDAHKLVKYSFKNVESSVSTSFIIPKKALNLLRNALGGAGQLSLSFNKANAFFEGENIQLICRLIDARYPDYNAVIPSDSPNQMIISRSDFQNSLKRIAIYANKTTNQVILNINDGSLTVSAQDLDFSNEAKERLTCNYNGDDMEIGFNSRFLSEMLNNLTASEVQLEMSLPNRAGILTPIDGLDEGEKITMLVMPVMLNS